MSKPTHIQSPFFDGCLVYLLLVAIGGPSLAWAAWSLVT